MLKPAKLRTLAPLVASFCAALLMFGQTAMLHAQDNNNVLGLPAVPQVPAASAAKSGAVPAAVSAAPGEAVIKSAISGNIKLASFYQVGLVTVRVATDKTYVGSALRAQALQAARLVQRDARLSCGKLCKPGPMPPPKLLADNTLSFDLVLSGYAGIISTVDMVNLVSAKPIGPGGKSVPAPVSASVVAATPTAAAPASEAPASSTTLR